MKSMYLRVIIVFSVCAAMVASLWLLRRDTPISDSTTLAISVPQVKRPEMPSRIAMLAMLRATFLAIDHGMKTGNYTVLRDLGSSRFRKANPAARLAQVFGSLAAEQVDLLPIAVVDPMYTKAPALTPDNMIYMAGMFTIEPKSAAFEVLLELEDDQWRIFAIAIAPAAGQAQ